MEKPMTSLLSSRSLLAGFCFILALCTAQISESFDRNTRNVFALAHTNHPVPYWVWKNDWIAGVALRSHWRTLEPQKGKYNWSSIDSEIAKSAASGKRVTLRIWGGATGTPDWIYKTGAQTFEWTVSLKTAYNMGQTFKAPLPWDPIWLREWMRFIRALGKKYNSNPYVVGITMTCGVGPWGEMYLPGSSEMKVGWRDLGWDDEKFVAAYKICIDTYADTFPNKRLAMSFSRPGDKPATVVFRILQYAQKRLGRRFLTMHNGLSGSADYSKFTIDSRKFHQRLIATICNAGNDGHPVGFQQRANRTVHNPQKLRLGQIAFGGPERMGSRGQEIANLELCRAQYVEVYLADLRGGPTTDAYRLWSSNGAAPR